MERRIEENLMAGVERRLTDYNFALDDGNKERLTEILESTEIPNGERHIVLGENAFAAVRNIPFIYNVFLRGVFLVSYFRRRIPSTSICKENLPYSRGPEDGQRFIDFSPIRLQPAPSDRVMREMELSQFYRKMVEAISAHPYLRQFRRQFKRTRGDRLNLELVESIMFQEGLRYLLVGAVTKHTKTINGSYEKIEPFIVGDNGEKGFSNHLAEWQTRNTAYLEEEPRLGRAIVRGWLGLPMTRRISLDKYISGVVPLVFQELKEKFYINL